MTCHPGDITARKVDWLATFADGQLSVEATVPLFDAVVGKVIRRRSRLLEVIEAAVPPGWTAMPFELPDLSENAPLRTYRAAIKRLFEKLPDPAAAGGRIVTLIDEGPEGRIDIAMYPKATGSRLGVEPGVGYVPNAEQRIAAMWLDERKRAQGRSAPQPAVMAIMGAGMGVDLEDFERGLFGRALSDGPMAVDTRPPWVGVLAFVDVGYLRGADPVLFASPHWEGKLPGALSRLEVRRLVEGRVTTTPALDRDILTGLSFLTDDEAHGRPAPEEDQ